MNLKRLYSNLYPQKPLYVPTFWAWLKLSRWPVYLQMRLRMAWFMIKDGGLGLLPADEMVDERTVKVGNWNKTNAFFASPFARRRAEHLIYILRAIPSISKDSRILCIGPRNEGELLLFRAHGFKNVKGVDLYSYSPWIDLMDMHRMTYMDNSFDVVFSSYVFRYSYDTRKCAIEMVRVCKDGGVIALGIANNPETNEVYAANFGNIDTLRAQFEPFVGHVYWSMPDDDVDESELPRHSFMTVFKVAK